MGTAAGDVEFRDVEKVHTVVARATDHPMDQLPRLFDATFGALFPALAERGLVPAGAAFACDGRTGQCRCDSEGSP